MYHVDIQHVLVVLWIRICFLVVLSIQLVMFLFENLFVKTIYLANIVLAFEFLPRRLYIWQLLIEMRIWFLHYTPFLLNYFLPKANIIFIINTRMIIIITLYNVLLSYKHNCTIVHIHIVTLSLHWIYNTCNNHFVFNILILHCTHRMSI
jgi:hypothetical protein